MSLFSRLVNAFRPVVPAVRGRPRCRRQASKSIADINVRTGDISVVERAKGTRGNLRVVRESISGGAPRARSAPPNTRVNHEPALAVQVDDVYAEVYRGARTRSPSPEHLYAEVDTYDALGHPDVTENVEVYTELMKVADDSTLPCLRHPAVSRRLDLDTRKRVKLASRRMNLNSLHRGRGDPQSQSCSPARACPYAIVDLHTVEQEDIIVTRFVRNSSATQLNTLGTPSPVSCGPPPSCCAPLPPLPQKSGTRVAPPKPPRRNKGMVMTVSAASLPPLPPKAPKVSQARGGAMVSATPPLPQKKSPFSRDSTRRSLRELCPMTPKTRRHYIYV